MQQRGRSNGFVLSAPLRPRPIRSSGLRWGSTWSFTSADLRHSESCPCIGGGRREEVMAAGLLRRAGTRSVGTFAVLVTLLSASPATSLPSSLVRGAVSCCRLLIVSFCPYLITQFFLQPGILRAFPAKWATNAAGEMEVWGQPLLAPPKAVPSAGDLLAAFALWWLSCRAGSFKSP